MHVKVLFETTDVIPALEHFEPALAAALTGVARVIKRKPQTVKAAINFFMPKWYLAKLDLSVLSPRMGGSSDTKTIKHIALTKPGRRYESQPQRPASDSRYSKL